MEETDASIVLAVVAEIVRSRFEALRGDTEDQMPAAVEFSPRGWDAFRADPEIMQYVLASRVPLEDMTFYDAALVINDNAAASWRVLSRDQQRQAAKP